MSFLDILYCDNHLLAVNKPVGMPTQPTPGNDRENLEDLAKAWIKEEFGKPGNVYLHTVHRLDREVSGVVLFARTSKALSRMNALMRDQAVTRIYNAMVSPPPQVDDGELQHWHQHGEHEAKVSRRKRPGAKLAILNFRELRREGNHSLLEISLVTGRYHQIRSQLAAEGMPILGDRKYGGRGTVTRGIFLHHARMEFAHPVVDVRVTLEAPLPPPWTTGLQCRPAPKPAGGSRKRKHR